MAKKRLRRTWNDDEKCSVCLQTLAPGISSRPIERGRPGPGLLAHIRRKFVDVQQSQGSAIAEEAIKRIATPYGIEKEAWGRSPAEWIAIRQKKAKPAIAFTLIETAKLNNVDRQAWLTDVLPDHKITRLGELKPWNFLRASDNMDAYHQCNGSSKQCIV